MIWAKMKQISASESLVLTANNWEGDGNFTTFTGDPNFPSISPFLRPIDPQEQNFRGSTSCNRIGEDKKVLICPLQTADDSLDPVLHLKDWRAALISFM